MHDKALSHFNARNKRIEKACYDTINTYKSIRNELKQLEGTKLPESLMAALSDLSLSNSQTLDALNCLSVDGLLHFYVCYFNKHELHDLNNFQSWLDKIKTIPHADRLIEHDYITRLALAGAVKARYDSTKIATTMLLSRKIAPPVVILSIRHLFQMKLVWNMGTCNSITRSMITINPAVKYIGYAA